MPDIWLFMNSFIGIHIRFFVCLLLHSLSSFFWQTTDLIFFTDIISKINSTKAIPNHSLLTRVSLKTMHSILIPLKKYFLTEKLCKSNGARPEMGVIGLQSSHYAHQLFEAFVQTALNQDVYLEGKKRRQSL